MILDEERRPQLLSRSRVSKKEKEDNRTRYEKRIKSKISSNVRNYNSINMNSLFKEGILTVDIEVQGETNKYTVTVSFGGFLDQLKDQLERSKKEEVTLKDIIRALINSFNDDDVYVRCSCLHPDTKIRLLDGSTPTVEEMKDRFDRGEKLYVYSTDERGDFKPGEVEKVWITNRDTDFIKVTLDNGAEITTTPNHLYMLRNGKYIEAKDLTPGTSLMPLYFSTTTKNYDTVKLNSTGKYHSVYKLVAKELFEDQIEEVVKSYMEHVDNTSHRMRYPVAIHHKDFNKHNNHPENLQVMSGYEHWRYHASLSFNNKPAETQERIREIARANAVIRNNNPTPAMVSARTAFVEKGRRRNYDTDRKLQQSAIMKDTMKKYYANLTAEEREELCNKRSTNTKNAWMHGVFDTEKFHSAAQARGVNMHTPEAEKLSAEGARRYWANISPEDKAVRDAIGRQNLEKALLKVRGRNISEKHRERIKEAKASRSREDMTLAARKCNETKIRKTLERLLLNHEELTEENYERYRGNKRPRITKLFKSIDEAVSYFKLNHKVISVERIELPETPVYDIKVKKWNNFLVDAGVILHNCPDYHYRLSYWNTRDKINIGAPENIPSNITNPNNDLGPGCKHIMLVLSNHNWILKVASTINNYIHYMEKHYERLYDDVIYPAIYGHRREEITIDDTELATDKPTLDIANIEGSTRGRFSKTYQPSRNPSIRKIRGEDEEVNEE